MGKQQYVAIAISIIVIIVLYFGMATMPPKQKEIEKSRSLQIEVTGTENIIQQALSEIGEENASIIDALNLEIDQAKDDSVKVQKIKNLASAWYEMGHPAVSAIYAEKVADIENSEAAWSITGTTFMIAARSATDDKVKNFCSNRASQAFEKAISLDSDKIEPKINQALVYVDNPSSDNPMKGILMLRELAEKYPENTSVLNQLAALALKTGQGEKALERLLTSYALDSENKQTLCLLAEAYAMTGNTAEAEKYKQKCSL